MIPVHLEVASRAEPTENAPIHRCQVASVHAFQGLTFITAEMNSQPAGKHISKNKTITLTIILHTSFIDFQWLKELCHEIQPNYEITKCPLN